MRAGPCAETLCAGLALGLLGLWSVVPTPLGLPPDLCPLTEGLLSGWTLWRLGRLWGAWHTRHRWHQSPHW
jgi:hypothetical protein